MNDNRKWNVVSDFVSTDGAAVYTTAEVFEAVAQLNAADPEGRPIALTDRGNDLYDTERGVVIAVPKN